MFSTVCSSALTRTHARGSHKTEVGNTRHTGHRGATYPETHGTPRGHLPRDTRDTEGATYP